jgi:hypothetical protein
MTGELWDSELDGEVGTQGSSLDAGLLKKVEETHSFGT